MKRLFFLLVILSLTACATTSETARGIAGTDDSIYVKRTSMQQTYGSFGKETITREQAIIEIQKQMEYSLTQHSASGCKLNAEYKRIKFEDVITMSGHSDVRVTFLCEVDFSPNELNAAYIEKMSRQKFNSLPEVEKAP